MKNYYYAKQGEDAQGPFSTDALKKLLSDGAIAAEDMVCEEGAEEWRTLASVFPPEKKWKEWMDRKVVVTGIVALLIGCGIGYALHPAGTASGKAGIAKNGIPVELKSEKARELFRRASQGNAAAQFELSQLYEGSEYVAQSYEQAVMWCKKAAEQEYVPAILRMGWFHRRGFGVKQDWQKSHQYDLQAALLGSPDGMWHVAGDYLIASGVEQSDELYMDWTKKAAAAGNTDSMLDLARAYISGNYGVSKNLELAENWIQKAKAGGNKEADNVLGELKIERDWQKSRL